MDLLERTFYGNPLSQWLIAAAIAAGVAIGLRLFKAIVLTRVQTITARTRTRIDDIVVRTLDHTRWFFYVGLGLYLGSLPLRLPESVTDVVQVAASIILFLQVGVWLQNAVRLSVEGYSEKHGDSPSTATMAAAIAFLARIGIWSIVFLAVLSNLGIEIDALIAGLGVTGIAVAFALQNVLGDLFASLSIYFDRPFDIGDFIIVDDYMGTVDRIGMRSTRIRSLGGEQIVFANSDLAKVRIRNYRRMRERRIAFSVGIEYNVPYEKVELAPKLLREAIEETPNTRFDRAHFKAFGAFSLDYEIVYWVLAPDFPSYMDAQQAINLAVYKKFEDAEIPFAFPTQTLHVKADEPLPIEQQANGRDAQA